VRVSIFGSCTTRDVFRLFPAEADVASYYSRSSLISVMAPPLAVDDAGISWPSNFARKVVLADFGKTFFDDLEAAKPDVLIVDLMSERFDLLRAPGTYITRSWELVNSGLAPRCGHHLERVPRETERMQANWLEMCEAFAATLRERASSLPVLLHKTRWTSRYRDGADIRLFPRDWRLWISRRNWVIEGCHEGLERLLPDLIVVEPRGTYVADARHRWGLGSSHYEDAYYDDVREQFHAVFHSFAAPAAA
jgi:hypothetical protein